MVATDSYFQPFLRPERCSREIRDAVFFKRSAREVSNETFVYTKTSFGVAE